MSTEKHDLQPQPERYIFTFGANHTHPITGERLGNCYVVIEGDKSESCVIMEQHFGQKWAFQYPSEEAAGVERYGLTRIDLPQPQEDKAVELKRCPFCGKEPVLSTMTVTPNAFKVRCNFCWARSGDHKDAEAAANAWNTRAYNPTETDDQSVNAAKSIVAAEGRDRKDGVESSEDVQCPFCAEVGFDLIGLKSHLLNDCKSFGNTERLRRL